MNRYLVLPEFYDNNPLEKSKGLSQADAEFASVQFDFNYEGIKGKVFSPQLMLLFSSQKVPATNMSTGQVETFGGTLFLKIYAHAFSEGVEYFEKEWWVSKEVLYGSYSDLYLQDLYLSYFGFLNKETHHLIKNVPGHSYGWIFVRKNFPYIISEDTIKDYGYHSGIVYELEKIIFKYPKVFEAFEIEMKL